MISEEMLKRAAAEADQAIRDSLPTPRECKHEFSSSFQKKMRRTLRKANHPMIYKLPKRVACFVLVAILGSGTWLAVDAEARAAFFAWVREQYETFVEYRFVGDTLKENGAAEYELTWLPEGYSLQKEHTLNSGTYLTYTDDLGQRITFSYLEGSDITSLFVASDYESVYSVQIGNNHAEFYQAGQETSSNALVWLSEAEEVCFCITASFSEDTMIKLAESVQKR